MRLGLISLFLALCLPLPSFAQAGNYFFAQAEEAKARVAQLGARNLRSYVEEHYLIKGELPQSLTQLEVKPNELKDAWDRPFTYQVFEGRKFSIRSLGKDGAPGGTGPDADIEVKGEI